MPKVQMYGCVVVGGKEYDNDDMLQLTWNNRWVYDTDWHFGGDLDMDECDIVVCGDHIKGEVFAGENALAEALAYASLFK